MSADQDRVFQDDDHRQQMDQGEPDQELDKKLAELRIVHFLFLAERGLTSVDDVMAAKFDLRTLGVRI